MRGSSEQEVAERILGHAELSGLQVKPYKTVAIWFFFCDGQYLPCSQYGDHYGFVLKRLL